MIMNTFSINLRNYKKNSAIILMLVCLSACSTLSVTDNPNRQLSGDPYEGFNRAMYSFNTAADKAVVKPIAKGYKYVLPKGVRKSVSHFFSNLNEPLNAANNLLQGDIDNALSSTYRFVLNSTFGVLGLFDVAKSHYNIEADREDFGQTLAAWGVKPGGYLVLPFLGPSNLRDGFGRVLDTAAYNPVDVISDNDANKRIGYTAVNLLDTRTNLLNLDKLVDSQPDPYAFVKVAYERARLQSIYDGNAPKNESEEIDDF